MDGLCLKPGIHGMPAPIAAAGASLDIRATLPSQLTAASGVRSSTAISAEKPSVSVPHRNSPWGFTFRYPLRSLWPGGRNRYDAIAADDAVSVEEKVEKKAAEEKIDVVESEGGKNGNWVLKIMHVKSLWRDDGEKGGGNEVDREKEIVEPKAGESKGADEEEEEDCEACRVDDDDEDDAGRIVFDGDSFSKLLRRVSLTEARLYAKMSYLGNLAYCIPQIKPGNLLRYYGLRYVTSSLDKEEEALDNDMKKEATEDEPETSFASEAPEEGYTKDTVEGKDEKNTDNQTSASAAYRMAASAASYLHSHTKSILSLKSSPSLSGEGSPERIPGKSGNLDTIDGEVASLMATRDSVTAVVAAKEEVKQAVADDLNSTSSSPCEWFVCDDDETATRFFVIQGSESLASWQANLLFEPIRFEGLDVPVHRGIYEAAKGIYEQMLPEVRAHLMRHGDQATFRFTGHSLGGSLSLLINLMLIIRGEVPPSSLLPVITFGAPFVMCGGDRLLHRLGLPRSHVQAITMHRDIVPRAFSCNYPGHVAEFLKAVNGNFRNHPCLNNQKLLYAPMGEFLILQPDEKFSPKHYLLPSGSGLYLLSHPIADANDADNYLRAAKAVFLNSPHPLEILSDRSAYGSGGTIQRDHDMNSYLKSVRNVIRQELNRQRKARREHRRRVWWPLVASPRVSSGSIVVGRPVASGEMGRAQFNFAGILQTGTESLKRFTTLVASQHMHLLVVLLFPARMLILGTYSVMNFN